MLRNVGRVLGDRGVGILVALAALAAGACVSIDPPLESEPVGQTPTTEATSTSTVARHSGEAR